MNADVPVFKVINNNKTYDINDDVPENEKENDDDDKKKLTTLINNYE